MTVDICRDPPKPPHRGHLECWDRYGCTDICRAPTGKPNVWINPKAGTDVPGQWTIMLRIIERSD